MQAVWCSMTFNMSFGDLLVVIGFFVTSAVMFARVDGRVTGHDKLFEAFAESLKELRTKHEALDNKIVDKLSNVEKSLAKIEGRLSIKNGGDE